MFVYKQKTAYEMRISDWSSDVCSSDLLDRLDGALRVPVRVGLGAMRSAIRLARQGHVVAEVKIGGLGVADRPFAARAGRRRQRRQHRRGQLVDRKNTRLNSSH